MANPPKTKTIPYRDETGKVDYYTLPIDAPDSEAPLGIKAALVFPARWEPVRPELEAALAARGIITNADLYKPGSDDLFRQAIQQVIAADIFEFKKHNPKEN